VKSISTPAAHLLTPLCSVAFGLAATTAAPAADVRTSRLFSDNMVLQRGKPVPVWGWGGSGDTVTVSFAEQTKTARGGEDETVSDLTHIGA